MAYSKWLIHDDCGWRNEPSMGNVWFTNKEFNGVCPRCGAPMPYDTIAVSNYPGWRFVTGREVWIPKGLFGMFGHWEFHEKES